MLSSSGGTDVVGHGVSGVSNMCGVGQAVDLWVGGQHACEDALGCGVGRVPPHLDYDQA